MSESDLLSSVVPLAGWLGWRVAHFRPAQTSSGRWVTAMTGDVGFPDLVLARSGRVIFAELKSERGRMGPGQDEWLIALAQPAEVFVWRPSDWLDGTIERVLR